MEWNVITQSATGRNGNNTMLPPHYQIRIADSEAVCVLNGRVTAIHAVAKNPRNIGPVNNTKDKRFVGIKLRRHGLNIASECIYFQ